jgi:hypothetical protein
LVGSVSGHLGEQLVAGDHAARLPQQHAQHAQRLRRQPARTTRTDDLDLARGQSDDAVADPYPIGRVAVVRCCSFSAIQ